MAIKGLHHNAYRCRDSEETRKFYEDFLGLPLDHPFRRIETVVATPHVGYITAEQYRLFYGQAVENILAFLDGKPVNLMNPEVVARR